MDYLYGLSNSLNKAGKRLEESTTAVTSALTY
jgi:hypothetical protein